MNPQIDKIYIYLLNRKPLEKERADLLGKSFSQINRNIINLCYFVTKTTTSIL